MAANVQFIFFRNPAGDVLVRILHNERDAGLPSAAVPITAGKPSGITANRCTNNARLAAGRSGVNENARTSQESAHFILLSPAGG